MAELKLSPSMINSFKAIVELDTKNIDDLFSKVSELPAGIFHRDATKEIQSEVNIEKDKLEKILFLFYGLSSLRVSSKRSKKQIEEDLLNSLENSEREVFENPNIQKYIQRILSIENSVFLTVATAEASSEREKLLHDAEIITDARPVFNDDEIIAFTTIHTLKLSISENGDDSTIYLALDKSDMEKLEKAIQQSRSREEVLISKISGNFVELS